MAIRELSYDACFCPATSSLLSVYVAASAINTRGSLVMTVVRPSMSCFTKHEGNCHGRCCGDFVPLADVANIETVCLSKT